MTSFSWPLRPRAWAREVVCWFAEAISAARVVCWAATAAGASGVAAWAMTGMPVTSSAVVAAMTTAAFRA